MSFVGVFIRANEVFFSYPKNGSIRQVKTTLPPGVGEDTLFSDRESFRRAFDSISLFLKEREGIASPDYILCIPDSFGIGERFRIFQYAGKCGVSVFRMITQTMAMGLEIYFHDESESKFVVGYEKDGDLLLCNYEKGNQVLEKESTNIFRNWRKSESERLECENNKVFWKFTSDAFDVFFAGSTETLRLLEKRIKATVPDRKIKSVQPYSEWNVMIGLAVCCGRRSGLRQLEGRSLNILPLDTNSPYPMIVAWKGEVIEFFDSDTTIPYRKQKNLINDIPDMGNTDYTLKLYEKRGDRFLSQWSIPLQKEIYKLEGKGNLAVKIDIDWKNIYTLSILSGKEELISRRVDMVMQFGDTDSKTGGRKEDRGELLTSLLPVIHNLSYGAKYSDDSNPYAKGMVSIYNQTKAILKQQGIYLIDKSYVPFNVRYHHAVQHVTKSGIPPNTVIKILQPGCIDHGKVIQPAYVIVAN